MAQVIASITTSVNGYVAGPGDAPGEPAIVVAPVILGGGKALFDGFTTSIELEQIGVRQIRWATMIRYQVKRWGR